MGRDGLEYAGVPPDVVERDVREPVVRGGRGGIVDVERDQFARLIRPDPRLQQKHVHQAEDRDVGADAKRQHEDDGDGEDGDPDELTEGAANVARQGVEPGGRPHRPNLLLDLFDPAEFEPRPARRFVGLQAGRHLLVGQHLHVAGDVGIQVVVKGTAPEQAADRANQASPVLHRVLPAYSAVRSASLIAAETRSHCSVSAARWRRPTAVRR